MSSNALYLRIGQARVLRTLSLAGREKGEVTTGSDHKASTVILTPMACHDSFAVRDSDLLEHHNQPGN